MNKIVKRNNELSQSCGAHAQFFNENEDENFLLRPIGRCASVWSLPTPFYIGIRPV